MTIGKKLEKARKEKGLTIKEVQKEIKIRSRYLEALENDKYDTIPGEAYIRAFIKTYANFLDLDYQVLIKQYREYIVNKQKKEKEEYEKEQMQKKQSLLHNKIVISSIIIGVILIVIGFIIYNVFLLNDAQNGLDTVAKTDYLVTEEKNDQDNNYKKIIKETDEDKIVQNEIDENKEVNNNINSVPNIEKKLKSIELIVTEKSWLQINVDGEIIFEDIVVKGEIKEIKGYNTLSLKIGNAAGVKVRKGNRIMGPWGKKGEVIKKVIDF